MKYTYSELAKMIDHSLLHPTMTDAELEAGCKLAAQYQVASVCIKPYAVKQAVQWLKGSGVLVEAPVSSSGPPVNEYPVAVTVMLFAETPLTIATAPEPVGSKNASSPFVQIVGENQFAVTLSQLRAPAE